jgi:hypothetical protein
MPIDVVKSIDNKLSIDNYNLLCIPGKEYLSSFDCSQSNTYRAIRYELQNCLIPYKKQVTINKTTDNDKNIIKFEKESMYITLDNCTVYDHIYYNAIFYTNENKTIKGLGLHNNWCNDTWEYIIKESFYEKNNILYCHTFLGLNDNDDIVNNNNIFLKPYYRFYKETLITFFNYMNCFEVTKVRNYNMERLLYTSISIIQNSCIWKDGFEMDISEYELLFNKMVQFNTMGDKTCIKCSNDFIKPLITFYCKNVVDNTATFEGYIEKWEEKTIEELMNFTYDETNNTLPNRFGILFDMIMEPSQYGVESDILFTLFFVILFISSIIIVYTLVKYLRYSN